MKRTRLNNLIVGAVGVALILTSTGSASAQTPFQAQVSSTQTVSEGPCANGAYACGTADLAGYGAASWNLYVTSASGSVTPCGSSYTATTYFTLVSDPSSTLVVDESGSLCGLGHDGAAYRAYFVQGFQAYGHPFAFVGDWSVDPTSSGQFAGLAGSGTDVINVAGAHLGGSYTGALG